MRECYKNLTSNISLVLCPNAGGSPQRGVNVMIARRQITTIEVWRVFAIQQ